LNTVKEWTLKPETRNEARYKPKVLIIILIKPRVIKVMGRRRILIIGLRISSKTANIRATFIIVSSLGEKERLPQISFSMTRAKAR
jgi:hypothetical protein